MDSESVILTASYLNNRTFRDEESWNSLQSTILAGQLSGIGDSDKLATVDEEEEAGDQSELTEEDVDILNTNMDAISDSEDVFFDCATIASPRPFYKIARSPMRVKVPRLKIPIAPSDASSIGFDPSSLTYLSYDGSSVEKERTGTLIGQMIEDMKDLISHPQSTPKSSPNTTEFSEFSEFCSTRSDAAEERTSGGSETGKAPSKRRHFFEDKENGGALPRIVRPKPSPKSPAVARTSMRRVAQMREFFENCSRTLSDQNSRPAPAAPPRRISYRPQASFKLLRTKSPKGKSPVSKSPKGKSSTSKSPTSKSPKSKSPKGKSPTSKSLKLKSPKSPENLELGSPNLQSCSSKIRSEELPRSKIPKLQIGSWKIQLNEKPRAKSPTSQKFDAEASKLQSRSYRIQLGEKSRSKSPGSQKLEVPKPNEIQTEEKPKSRSPKRRGGAQKQRSTKSPKSIHSQETLKLPGSSKKGPRHLRISSSSETFSAAGSSDLSRSSRRSKSLSDAFEESKGDKVELLRLEQALRMNRISARPHFLIGQRSHLRVHRRTPKKCDKSISKIVNRKSLDPNATVKPVKELRKIFSPAAAPKENRRVQKR